MDHQTTTRLIPKIFPGYCLGYLGSRAAFEAAGKVTSIRSHVCVFDSSTKDGHYRMLRGRHVKNYNHQRKKYMNLYTLETCLQILIKSLRFSNQNQQYKQQGNNSFPIGNNDFKFCHASKWEQKYNGSH
uniref:uncharacterized protein LOC122592708 n=1 Tax=Erigeron canadensis TaxID=72917 RepID=UPI001CB9983D|nr:uncharacterized protein LOC122592708 [Erigeron canadensis]